MLKELNETLDLALHIFIVCSGGARSRNLGGQRSAESRGFSPGTPCFLPQGKLIGWVRHIGLEADH